MNPWNKWSVLSIRLTGLGLMILGGFLFVWSVKYISSEWPQIFVGLLSVFSTGMGFGILIMPMEDMPETQGKENPPTS
jgi:hypothetical protein